MGLTFPHAGPGPQSKFALQARAAAGKARAGLAREPGIGRKLFTGT